jgi:hypothetical protein
MMADGEIDAIFMRSAGYGRDDYRSFVRAVLAAQPAPVPVPPGWINTKDRMPEPDCRLQ